MDKGINVIYILYMKKKKNVSFCLLLFVTMPGSVTVDFTITLKNEQYHTDLEDHSSEKLLNFSKRFKNEVSYAESIDT